MLHFLGRGQSLDLSDITAGLTRIPQERSKQTVLWVVGKRSSQSHKERHELNPRGLCCWIHTFIHQLNTSAYWVCVGVSGYLYIVWTEQSPGFVEAQGSLWGVGREGELHLLALTWPLFYWLFKCVFCMYMWHLASVKVLMVSEVTSVDNDALNSLTSSDIWGVGVITRRYTF